MKTNGTKDTIDKDQLKQMQWDVAMNGNVKMLIWLGKQYLGQ